METRKLSLVYAISGFIYTLFLFFVFLIVFQIYNIKELFLNVRDYLPYLSIIIFFLAYIIGIIFEAILQKIVNLLLGKPFDAEYQVKIMNCENDSIRNSIYISFDKLVILRHFIFGPLLLIISSILWVFFSNFENKDRIILYILVAGGLVVILSTIAYRIRRAIHMQLKLAVDNFLNKRTGIG